MKINRQIKSMRMQMQWQKEEKKVGTYFLKSERQIQKLETRSIMREELKKKDIWRIKQYVMHNLITEATLKMHKYQNKILLYLRHVACMCSIRLL